MSRIKNEKQNPVTVIAQEGKRVMSYHHNLPSQYDRNAVTLLFCFSCLLHQKQDNQVNFYIIFRWTVLILKNFKTVVDMAYLSTWKWCYLYVMYSSSNKCFSFSLITCFLKYNSSNFMIDFKWYWTNLIISLICICLLQGVHFSRLVKDTEWLKEEITSRGRDVGFTGKTEDVVKHAIKLLGKKLVSVQRPDLCPDVVPPADGPKDGKRDDFVIPNTQLPGVFELSYYANTVISVFLMESVIG